MKSSNVKIVLLTIITLILVLLIHSCRKYYIDHGFRQTYNDTNALIHDDLNKALFFKVHLKNGNVYLLDKWELDNTQDVLKGEGALFDFNRKLLNSGIFQINLRNIAIIETNDFEKIKTKDKENLSTLAVLTGINLLGDILCITNPKACFGSCPTFYEKGNEELQNSLAEGFSSSITPSLEIKDKDALQLTSSAPVFSLIMKNEALETHMINELFIEAVPKKINENIFQTKSGEFYKCNNLINPNKAFTNNKDIYSSIKEIDDTEYYSKTHPTDLTSKEEVILEFNDLKEINYGLVINFRQTLLTTFLLYSGLSYMGDEVGDYFTKIETNQNVKKLLRNPFKRLGGIKLYFLDEKTNKWILFDDIYETGPIAKNLIISPITLNKISSNDLKIKIEMTRGLWRLDYLSLTEIKSKVNSIILYPTEIVTNNGNNFSISDINKDDNDYVISFPGNEFEFLFEIPTLDSGEEFELFLNSKGYYLEWIRKSWLEDKNIPKLKNMLTNDKDTWTELAKEFKSIEHEMESVFWNSKYENIQ